MKNCIFLLYLLLGSRVVYSQTSKNYEAYYKICNEALTDKVNSNFAKAAQHYEQIFDNYVPFIDDLIDLKTCYKELGDNDKVTNVWKQMVLAGYTLEGKSYLITPGKSSEKWSNSIPQDEQELFDKINYDSLHQVYMQHIDFEKTNYLQAIITAESFIASTRHSSSDIKLHDLNWSVLRKLFINLAKSSHLPSRQESNLWEDSKFIISLLHMAQTPPSKKDEFFDLLWKQVIEGNLSSVQYAAIYDAGNGKLSRYGMRTKFTRNGRIEIALLENIEQIDEIRNTAFLPPLWVWAKRCGYILPKGYKLQTNDTTDR